MSYEMKKALRKSAGAKSYAQPEQQGDINPVVEGKERERQVQKESIFQHKNWNPKQKVKLMVFLNHYHALPDWQSERRSIHLYKHLSTFLKKTRTPEQCKNIHSLFKRKFHSLEDVVDAMKKELQEEENYERLLAKYEREIQKFQNEYMLFEGVTKDRRTVQAIRSRKAIEQEKQEPKPEVKVKQYDQSDNVKINFADNIKQEQNQYEKEQNQYEKSVNQLVQVCQFYFNEWLKSVSVIEYKNKIAAAQQS